MRMKTEMRASTRSAMTKCYRMTQEKCYQKMMIEIGGDKTGMIVEAAATLIYNRVV
jgi:hypothetical protein